jgi:positive regulator of sigma E activity
MDCVGTVISTHEGRAVVRVERGNCGECKGCGLLSRAPQEPVDFELENPLEARPGDRVSLRMPSGRLFHAYLLAFGLPVLAMPAGYLLGAYALAHLLHAGSQAVGVVLAILAGGLAFWGGLRLTGRLGLDPRMERVESYAGEASPAGPSGREG